MMKPNRHMPLQNWMQAPQTKAVMRALSADAPGIAALFVGGCVRNMLAGEEVGDIDIATVHAPDEVILRLERSGIKAVPTGIDHGTVTAVTDGESFEITTLRRDVETDGRRAVVAFTDCWKEDAARRDFTINTLLCDLQGDIYDPLGRGVDDLESGRVVFVGDAQARVAEDYLRVLRFFRFHARYGRGAPDAAALKACREGAERVSGLSAERITQELFKLLMVSRPANAIAQMFYCGVLTMLKAPGWDASGLEALCDVQALYKQEHLPARLFVLAGCDLDALKAFEPPLIIPRLIKKDAEALAQAVCFISAFEAREMRAAVYRFGRMAAVQALMLAVSRDRVMHGDAAGLLTLARDWIVPTFSVSGHDLAARGIAKGPAMGEILERLEEEWIGSDFSLSAADLLSGI